MYQSVRFASFWNGTEKNKMSGPIELIKGQFTELVVGMENVISTLEKKKIKPCRRNRKTKT